MRSTFFLIYLAFVGTSCSQSKLTDAEQQQVATIDSLETILFADKGTLNNRDAAYTLVKAYAGYYQAHKTDTAAINMLFKAGEVSMGLSEGRIAVKYFGIVAEEHPDFKKAPEALFLQAFCEETLNADFQQAKFFYEEFVKKHPAHALAKDAQFSISNLGKTDEELIKMFEENAKKAS
jgi:TolA-binding protein